MMMMQSAMIGLSMLLAGGAAAAPHSLDIRIIDGRRVYKLTGRFVEGQQNVLSKVLGVPARRMIFNGVLAAASRGQAGVYDLGYQAELSAEGEGPMIQTQGTLGLRPGAGVTVVGCGPWKMELTLDGGGGKANAVKPAGNLRLTADFTSGRQHERCLILTAPEAQSNVVDGVRSPGKQYGFVLNSQFSASGDAARLKYQVSNIPPGGGAVQGQGEQDLALGRRASVSGQGYRLDFLLEADGPPVPAARPAEPAAPAPAPSAPPASAPAEEHQSVPLLR